MKALVTNILIYLSLATSIFLSACSTPLKQAGSAHAITLSKWQELATYAESQLGDYPIAITAQLTIAQQEGKARYQLANIRLIEKENSYNINLLTPSFEHKYICNPVCKQLIEYVEDSPTRGSTLLNEFFSQHEFELFNFYGKLFKLNEPLQQLAQLNAYSIGDYLKYVSQAQRKFQSLDRFIAYLRNNLKAEKYQHFLDTPSASNIRKKARQVKTLFRPPPELEAEWSSPSEVSSPDMKLLQRLSVYDKLDWRLFPESIRWQHRQFTPWKGVKGSTDHILQGSWLIAKNYPIQVNKYVCSYSDNTFGRVSKVSDSTITVELIGQAKLLQDGILHDLDEGALFSPANKSLTFLPLQGSQSFASEGLALCQDRVSPLLK